MAYPKPNKAYVNQLVAQIERSPRTLEPRKLLMQQYVACGLFTEAGEQAMEILTLDPTNTEAKNTRELEEGYNALKKRATLLHKEAQLLQSLKGMRASDFADLISSFAAIAGGSGGLSTATEANAQRTTTTTTARTKSGCQGRATALTNGGAKVNAQPSAGGTRQVASTSNRNPGRTTNVSSNMVAQKEANEVAAGMAAAYKSDKTKALDLAFEDLKNAITRKARDPSDDREADRQASLRRMNELRNLLPRKLQPLADEAQMHVEHEILHRKYVNTDTLYLEPVAEIVRANFWVSEDAYAWNMEELAAAIESNRGIMRNPLSKLMFHPRDVRAIVQHPLGKHLAAIRIDQSELKEGVRELTVTKLDKLAQKLLDDNTEDFAPSHRAVETFAAYLATLPQIEQKAIDNLWVPAVDSHTGMQFDMAVGQSVRDAQSNLVCFHKTGDLLSQAVAYLRGDIDYYA